MYMIYGNKFNIRHIIKQLFFNILKQYLVISGGLVVKRAVFHIQSNLVK